jgi:hypothetical protein
MIDKKRKASRTEIGEAFPELLFSARYQCCHADAFDREKSAEDYPIIAAGIDHADKPQDNE